MSGPLTIYECPVCGTWSEDADYTGGHDFARFPDCHRNQRVPARVFREEDVRTTLCEHYLAGVECDHDRKMDRPSCACSLVDLGWHPSVGHAVQAWIDHVLNKEPQR